MVARMVSILWVLLALIIACSHASKLLVISFTGSKSHMMSNGRIADALALDGHNVTFLSFETLIETKDFPTTKHAKVVTVGKILPEQKAMFKKFKGDLLKASYQKGGLFDSYFMTLPLATSLSNVMDLALTENKAIFDQLKAEKFDALFTEQLFPHGHGLGHLLGIDVHFLIHSCPIMEHSTSLFGIPNPGGWVPAVGKLPVSDKMTFFERAQNELEQQLLAAGYSALFAGTTNVFRKHFGSNFPAVEDIIREKVPLSFVAVDEFLEFPRPVLHNIVYIGGLGMTTAKKAALEVPFNAEMEKGKKGVVFFSLGSNVDSTNLPEAVKKNLLDGFADFPDYHFIVKLEATDTYGIDYAKTKKNVFVTHWAPQVNLLQHPRMKLFFTHGGYNSLLEVAHSGTPVLLMPMMFDQTRNGQIIQRNGWGKVLDKVELLPGKEKLVEVLREMLGTDKYEKSARRIQHLLETKPFTANEVFTKNVKFVLDNGGKLPELRPASMDMNFITQNNIDVYIVFITVVLAFIGLVLFLVIKIAKALLSLSKSKNVTKVKKN